MRYILYPGDVTSLYDGQTHFIGSRQLATLYKVDLKKCVVLVTPADFERYTEQPGDIHLRPNRKGNYNLPNGGSNGKARR